MGNSYLERQLQKYRNHPVAITQEAILDLVAEICKRMETLKMKRKELARKASLDPAQVTRILSGNHNITMATLGKLASALEVDLKINLQERSGIQFREWNPADNCGNSKFSISGYSGTAYIPNEEYDGDENVWIDAA